MVLLKLTAGGLQMRCSGTAKTPVVLGTGITTDIVTGGTFAFPLTALNPVVDALGLEVAFIIKTDAVERTTATGGFSGIATDFTVSGAMMKSSSVRSIAT